MPSQSEKHTLFQSNVVKIYTFFRHKQFKNIPFGAAHSSDNLYRGVIPAPPLPESKTHKNTVSLPGKFLCDILQITFTDPFGFKIKIVCFERVIKSFYSLFFFPFFAMRDKFLSIDHCLTDHSPSDAIFTFSMWLSKENST